MSKRRFFFAASRPLASRPAGEKETPKPARRFLKNSKYKYEIAVKYQNMKYALVYSKYQNIILIYQHFPYFSKFQILVRRIYAVFEILTRFQLDFLGDLEKC